MEELRVGTVFGSKSAEHEVSLQSAKNIVNVIDKGCFDAALLGIGKQGRWHVDNASNYLLSADDPTHIASRPSTANPMQVPDKREHQLIDAQDGQPLSTVGIIFPIVHDTLSEDGSLQEMLRVADLPFVGFDIPASAICANKDVIGRLLRNVGLSIVPFITLTCTNHNNISSTEVESKLGLPLFVKSVNQGSSAGVSRVASEEQHAIAADLALEFDHKAIVEQGIKGHETECAVLGDDNLQASTCGEIVLTNDFYVCDTKYIDRDGTRAVIPAAIVPEINDKTRAVATQVYQALGCASMAHIDVFLAPKNEVVISEINALPGLANISIYPELWQANGSGYTDLITRLAGLVLKRHAADSALKTTM